MLKDYIFINNSFSNRGKEGYIKKHYYNYWNEIYEYNLNYNFGDITFKQKLYNYIFNITEIPKCICGNECEFRGRPNIIYYPNCSSSCAAKSCSVKRNQANKKTCMEKYGVDNVFKLESIKQKSKNTCLEKYGVENVNKSKEFRNNIEKTNMERYGVKTVLILEHVREKNTQILKELLTKEYMLENKIGFCNNETLEKSKKILFDKIGVDNPWKCKNIQNKIQDDLTNNRLVNKYNIIEKLNVKYNINLIKYLGSGIYELYCEKCKKYSEMNLDLIRSRYDINSEICLNCNPISIGRSSLEYNLYENILNIYDGDILLNHRINNLEIDIYLKDLNIGFEFNGLYWHSSKHKSDTYHKNKYEHFLKENITIYNIWEDEWKYKKDLIISQIKNLIISNDNIVYDKLEMDIYNGDNIDIVTNYNKTLSILYNNEILYSVNINIDDDIIVSDFKNFNFNESNAINIILEFITNKFKYNNIYLYSNRILNVSNEFKIIDIMMDKFSIDKDKRIKFNGESNYIIGSGINIYKLIKN